MMFIHQLKSSMALSLLNCGKFAIANAFKMLDWLFSLMLSLKRLCEGVLNSEAAMMKMRNTEKQA